MGRRRDDKSDKLQVLDNLTEIRRLPLEGALATRLRLAVALPRTW